MVNAPQSILIISPESWDFIHISKHHYAKAAADAGYQVYFLEPPDPSVNGVLIAPTTHPRVSRVRYPMVRYMEILRFHARPIYNWMEKLLIAKLARTLPPLDLVWSFERNRFVGLRTYGARKVIYHPVDSVSEPHQLLPAREADHVFCVSKTILAPFTKGRTPASLLPHGISPEFASLAERGIPWVRPRGPIKVGFAGNLARPIIAREVVLALLEANPQVEFHFWGQCAAVGDSDLRAVEFANSLRKFSNCHLRGQQTGEAFVSQLGEMDIFLLAYQPDPKDPYFDFSNSHKVLEYLSTGRVLLSSPLSEYENCPKDFIIFAENNDKEAFIEQFSRILEEIDYLNGVDFARQRRACALEHRYSAHWMKINDLMLCKNRHKDPVAES